MRIQNKLKGTQGFVTAWNSLVRYRYMVTDKAKYRLKVLRHWETYGIDSAMDAFEVKRRTLFHWKWVFEQGGAKAESLNPKSRAPRRRRARSWSPAIQDELRRLRNTYPNLGKEKLYPLLRDYVEVHDLGACPTPSTIGRLIKDLGGLRLIPQKITNTGRIKQAKRQTVVRKPKGFKATYPGHCIALDTIEKQREGRRLYVLTAIDLYTRTAFAIATRSHSSRTAAHFLSLVVQLFPYPVHTVLSDNGSEFKKYVRQFLTDHQVMHYHTYPKTPKQNAHCERFNGVIQTEYVDYHRDLLFTDLSAFNQRLAKYLTFYNTKRVHHAFGNKLTPFAVLNRSEYYRLQLPAECKNGWTYTHTRIFWSRMV